MFSNDSPYNKQTQTTAGRFGGEVRSKELAHIFGRKPSAGIGERNRHKIIVAPRANVKNSSGPHRLESVLDDIVERLFHLISVNLYSRQPGGQIGFDQDIAILDFPSQESHGLLYDFVQVMWLKRRSGGPNRLQELMNDRIKTLDFSARDFQKFLDRIPNRSRHPSNLPLD
jgi:hypothetical protein